jgi:hypothetical protein
MSIDNDHVVLSLSVLVGEGERGTWRVVRAGSSLSSTFTRLLVSLHNRDATGLARHEVRYDERKKRQAGKSRVLRNGPYPGRCRERVAACMLLVQLPVHPPTELIHLPIHLSG